MIKKTLQNQIQYTMFESEEQSPGSAHPSLLEFLPKMAKVPQTVF